MAKQLLLGIHKKKIVDGFAGIGGMSIAFEKAFGRSPDVAFNHNDDAVSCHRLNHPTTRHFCADAYEVDPRGATMNADVGWFHYSPDCTHFSQASGGQPRSKKIRGLSWSGLRWAGQAKPDVISLENVRQILTWSPLIAKRDPTTGRVIKLVTETVKGKKKVRQVVAEPGECVPVQQQYLIPDPKREGETWRKFVRQLEEMGYKVDWRILVAANLGGHTTRERLFLIARRDGLPIVFPEQTHFKNPKGKQKAHKPAADCIDFSDLGKSIFGRKKELAAATKRRIAKGIKKFVLDNPKPFIVPIAHYNGRDVAHSVDDPFRTITAQTKGGEFSLVSPILAKFFRGQSLGTALDAGMPTISGGGDCARPAGAAPAQGVVAPVLTKAPSAEPVDEMDAAYLLQANGGFNDVRGTPGHDMNRAFSSITSAGSQQQLVTANLAHFRGNCDAGDLNEGLKTVSAEGQHHGLVSAFLAKQSGNLDGSCSGDSKDPGTAGEGSGASLMDRVLSPEQEAGALRAAAFLMEYFSEGGQWCALDQPINTITTRERFALVTVFVKGEPYVITDIRLRMLKPRELARGQDFPEDYIIDRGHDGRRFPVSTQVRMIGNSVDPVMAEAFLRANAPWLSVRKVA